MISTAFQFCFMALAVNVIDRHGPSNKNASQLQPKKIKVPFTCTSLLKRRSTLVFKVVCHTGVK